MMRRISSLLLLALCSLPRAETSASTGVECELSISQVDTVRSQDVLLYCDTVEFVTGMPASGFLLAFSVDVNFTETDSVGTAFTVHVVTLGPPVNTYSRSFVVEYGLPAEIRGIRGKGLTDYGLALKPLRAIELDTSLCSFNHRAEGVFTFTPSANMDIYYVPNSLGDFYWATARGILEEHYRGFQALCNFSLPGKYNIYLCPCHVYSAIWDKRFSMSIDPTRSSAHALFTKTHSTAEPFLINHTALLRNFGYSPPVLSEGLANILSVAVYDTKQMLDDGRLPGLSELLDTYRYFEGDPYVADRSSASLVSFLVNQYGFGRFKKLYEMADDLNLADTIEKVYESSLTDLEAKWEIYIDTCSFSNEQLMHTADLAEAMFNVPMMLHYAEALAKEARTRQDSLMILPRLKRAYFFAGDYYAATAVQEALVRLDSLSAEGWMALGSFRMINAYYDQAYADLMRAQSLDSSEEFVAFNLAMWYLSQGDSTEAAAVLSNLLRGRLGEGSHPQAGIVLAQILRQSGNEAQQAEAETLLTVASNVLNSALRQQPSLASTHMWLGIAALCSGETGLARDYLEGALFLETRPFYQGMIHLWLGKTSDTEGQRELAVEHYRQVLSLASAAYHQTEAREYIEKPYTN